MIRQMAVLRSRVRGALTGEAMGMGLLAAGCPAAAAVLRHDRQGHRNLEIRKIAISHAQFRRPIPKARFHVQRRHRRELPSQTPSRRMARLVRDSQVVAAVASGGGGASSSEPWIDDPEKQRQVSDSTVAAGKQQTAESKTRLEERSGFSNSAPQMHSEVRNGYEYQIDDKGRTRSVSGALVLAGKQVRSRTAQAQAGGVERKPTDDGGH
jgi:hypothetical protein